MHLPWDSSSGARMYYRLGPLVYSSELVLSELPEAPPPGEDDASSLVSILRGHAPDHLDAPIAHSDTCEANAREFLLRLPGVAKYYVRDGSLVTVEPAPGAADLDVRAYLMGNIFAVLCHQRGLLPLHASAIATPRGAVAFLGESGAGKSSLVAFLGQQGHTVLADDICLIDPDAPLDRRVLPVAPWLKLWRTTLNALGESSDGLPRTFTDDDKYRYTMPQHAEPAPLAELLILERAVGPESHPHFERLSPVRALHAVLELTYQSWLVRAIGQTEAHFLRCGRALEGVRVYRMRRPWGFDSMDATLAALEAHLAAELASSKS